MHFGCWISKIRFSSLDFSFPMFLSFSKQVWQWVNYLYLASNQPKLKIHSRTHVLMFVNLILVAPEISRAPSIAKSAAQTHTDGLIKCNLDAFPEPTVAWSKEGAPIVLDDAKYSMATKTEGVIHFSFQLTITNVRDSDYGSYTCTATNSQGTDTHQILLGGTSKWYYELIKHFLIFLQKFDNCGLSGYYLMAGWQCLDLPGCSM